MPLEWTLFDDLKEQIATFKQFKSGSETQERIIQRIDELLNQLKINIIDSFDDLSQDQKLKLNLQLEDLRIYIEKQIKHPLKSHLLNKIDRIIYLTTDQTSPNEGQNISLKKFSQLSKKYIIFGILGGIIMIIISFMINVKITKYEARRYASTGLSNSNDYSKFSPNYESIEIQLEIIRSHIINKDTNWLKENLGFSDDQVQNITNLRYEKDLKKHKYILIEIIGQQPIPPKTFDQIADYINNQPNLKALYQKQQQYLDSFLVNLDRNFKAILYIPKYSTHNDQNIILPVSEKIFYFATKKDIYKRMYSNPLFYYLTDCSSNTNKKNQIPLWVGFAIGFLLTDLIILIAKRLFK